VPSNRIDETYRGHRIVAGEFRGKAAAIVYRQAATIKRLEAATVAEAFADARAAVDELLAEARSGRRAPYIASVAEYEMFFRGWQPAKGYLEMLQAHANAPGRVLTATQLAHAAGWKDLGAANLHYGWIGGEIADQFGLDLPRRADGTTIKTRALADEADGPAPTSEFRWKMHREVALALSKLNLARPPEDAE
jgi:hypothetical protein